MEDVYLKYKANRGGGDVRAVKSGQWEYLVDFMGMKQTNIQHENHTQRDIRRIKNSAYKGDDEEETNNNKKAEKEKEVVVPEKEKGTEKEGTHE